MQTITIPDIGDYSQIPVIEVLIRAGDAVAAEQPVVTLESDKATMDVPSDRAGTIREVLLKPGDLVSKGTPIARIEFGEVPVAGAAAPEVAKPAVPRVAAPPVPSSDRVAPAAPLTSAVRDDTGHAGPSVRKLARELGVSLTDVRPSGPKGRALRADVLAHAKSLLTRPDTAAPARGGDLDLLPWPKVDFARFGAIEREPLSRVRRISGANLHRNWVSIPHVTNFDQADISALEAFRVALNEKAKPEAARVTLLAFLVRAAAAALRTFPQFNVSLEGTDVIRKHYVHIGFAADTPSGLVVPVIRDADTKGVLAIAAEMADLAATARAGKLKPDQMQGGCFSISSLGGIGGSHFTPIINAPEVAILGVGKASMQPCWDGSAFQPRLQLPMSLSWDHRAVDGAEAGRFLAHLAGLIADFRRVLL
ncbi:2-oxo acid dehydrogenase subunit E2 [Cupriavidus pauculus]|uniref:Dihydrolipoamide acetyltransferase component of pyruvate dehydrogenase complex n=1 Tax=Cupriavidus pauculus TaxID=82633 RepID=A0A3G8H999_9BURK|nr:2-oxo acid dehydrogenase subunit E2 [Cupriavidus pauculus]AZG16859.1 dihydrolipoamide acetyltransferase [Cupriavidus pauculus]